MSEIITEERTPKFLAERIGDVRKTRKSYSNFLLMFSLQAEDLVSAIGYRPEIADELAEEAETCEAMAMIWARAKAGLDAKAAADAIDEMISSHHSRITVASLF